MLLAGALVLVALAMAFQYLAPDTQAQAREAGVRILRVMTDNPNTCMPVCGEYRDWVELVNLSDVTVSTAGWRLSAEVDIRGGFALPERQLQPGQSLILYEGEAMAGAAEPELFMGFSLSTDGIWLFLSDARETILDAVEVPALEAGSVYALDLASGEYSQRSPYDDLGAGMDLSRDIEPEYAGGLVISELMASNGSVLRDGSGEYSDWIEIYNGGSTEINLSGYTLSDNETDRRRYVFPEKRLAAGEYCIVFASGAEPMGDELHAPFRLSAEGERVVLFDPDGAAVSYMRYDALEKNQSLIRLADGSVQASMVTSPGNENTAAGAWQSLDPGYTSLEANGLGLYINEVMCATKGMPDWVELVNGSDAAIDLSGFGLSDNSDKVRKWQFPEGAAIPAHSYLVVLLKGAENTVQQENGCWCVDFALDVDSDQLLLLSDSEGEVIDRMLLSSQRQDVSYGRSGAHNSYRYFTTATPGKVNSGDSYAYCARNVVFSHQGGVQDGPISLELQADAGMSIYYTTDGTEPTYKSNVYIGPLQLDSNTVVRACAWRKDGIPSDVLANTYIFGVEHGVGIVAVSGKRSELIGSSGALVDGKGTSGYDVQVEIYDANGAQIINQECMLKLNGRSSRSMFAQKAFRLVAKKEYGENRFRAALFSERDYEEYDAVVVRAAGQDNQRTFMRDVVITSLARNTSVMYQESEPVVVYINGKYWGVYHLRERIDLHSICQFEGWENEDAVDLLEGRNTDVIQGSSDGYWEMMNYVRKYGVKSDANLEKLRQLVDVENYLDYVILQIYCNNQDLNNIRVYRSSEGDGKWRWILFDTDLGFLATRNSVKAWASTSNGGKVGSISEQYNLLFTELMKNASVRDYFLTRFGELLATDLSAESVVGRIQEIYDAIAPEMKLHCKRWNWKVSSWQEEGGKLISYVKGRPATLVSQLIDEFDLDSAQAQHYFGAAATAAGM